LVHLGRAFVIEVELLATPSAALRCRSFVDIPAAELFAPPSAVTERSFAHLVEQTGRVEALWFPFTPNPWVKVWSTAVTQPAASRLATAPYNYPFSDRIPRALSDLARRIIERQGALTPEYAA